MKAVVTQIAAVPGVDRPALTPELNAAVAARHSRTPDGLESILESIKDLDPDTAVDRVFKFVDYGHRSILDMIPVSIHLEGVSLWLAQLIWGLVRVGGGQETSTRYCSSKDAARWKVDYKNPGLEMLHGNLQDAAMETYQKAIDFWTEISIRKPEVMSAPAGSSEKVMERYRRNFVFDRSRYHLPLTLLTNMNVTTWGTEWVRVVCALSSSPWPEAVQLSELIIKELHLVAPRLIRHTSPSDAWRAWWKTRIRLSLDEIDHSIDADSLVECAKGNPDIIDDFPVEGSVDLPRRYLDFLRNYEAMEAALGSRKNRYDPVGPRLEALPVTYGWTLVANAEIRDMNRHRPGIRSLWTAPNQFYCALDQVRKHAPEMESEFKKRFYVVGYECIKLAREVLMDEDDGAAAQHIYACQLGTCFDFQHTNTLGHLIYEIELRTGPGTHYRYRDHYLELFEDLKRQAPNLANYLLIGTGEPE